MRMDPPFPENRLEDPARRAELGLYRQLAHSDAPGRALYEIRASQECRELDFLLYLAGVARVGIEVKGGAHRLLDSEWQLWAPTGWRTKGSPLVQLLEAANGFGNVMEQRLGRRCAIRRCWPSRTWTGTPGSPDWPAPAGSG